MRDGTLEAYVCLEISNQNTTLVRAMSTYGEIGEDMREAHFSCQLCLALEFKFCEVGNDMLEAHFCHALFQHCAQVS